MALTWGVRSTLVEHVAHTDRMFIQVQEQGHQELLNLTTAIAESVAGRGQRLRDLQFRAREARRAARSKQ